MPPPHTPWPQSIWLVRHGQSAGNVARDEAENAGLPTIAIAARDMDVPLSALGERQSAALGGWIETQPPPLRPTVMLCSPYARAQQTMALLMAHGALDGQGLRVDERLREKEFGVLDRLTRRGIEQNFPDLAAQRTHVGKFYFRPPGGESWCDVILRLRSVVDTLTRDHAGERVLIVAHQVVVNCMRYLLERMDEAAILAIDQQGDVPNCALTAYELDPAASVMQPKALNFVAPLQASGTPVTAAADAPAAPKS